MLQDVTYFYFMHLSHGQQITHTSQIRKSVSSIKRKKFRWSKLAKNVAQRFISTELHLVNSKFRYANSRSAWTKGHLQID